MEIQTIQQKYRILILGAGLSCPVGLPTATELWQEIFEKAKTLWGRAAKFYEDLDAYIKYRRECDGREIVVEKVEIGCGHFVRCPGFVCGYGLLSFIVFVGGVLNLAAHRSEKEIDDQELPIVHSPSENDMN